MSLPKKKVLAMSKLIELFIDLKLEIVLLFLITNFINISNVFALSLLI